MARGTVTISGGRADEFAKLAAELKRAGATGLQKEIGKAQSRVARKAKPAVLASSQALLPKGGGRGRRGRRLVGTGETLTNTVSGRTHAVKRVQMGGSYKKESVNDRVQAATFTVRSSQVGRVSRVRIIARDKRGKKIDLQSLDGGELRHPTFGRRQGKGGKSLWQSQRVPPGFFTKPLQALRPDLLDELDQAVKVIERVISGR